MKFTPKNLFLLFILSYLCQINSTFGQDFFPPITNYTTNDYGHDYAPENFGITQDQSGVMYFGNTSYIFAFDGTRWDTIPVISSRVTRSLHSSKDGIIYVGVMGDFGYLSIDSIGRYEYQSLVDSSMRESHPFQDIWSIIETSEGIFFQSEEQIFLYKNDKITLLPMPSTVHTVFEVNDKLVARMRDYGLMQWDGKEWQRIQGSEPFEIYAAFGIIPFKDKKEHLIITQEIGLYKWTSQNTIVPIESSNNEYLNSLLIFGARKIGSNRISLKTFDKGSIIIDFEGNEVGRINKRMGLRSNEVKSQFVDSDGNLWMGLGNGIALVNLDSRLSYFGERQGLIGGVEAVLQTRVNNSDHLFVATNEGLFRINQKDESLFRIYEKIEAINYSVWSLKQYKNLLYIGTSEGLFTLDLTIPNAQPKRINRQNVNALYINKELEHLIIAGKQGLQVLKIKSLTPIYTVVESFSSVINIESRVRGDTTNYWLGLHSQGVLKLSYVQNKFNVEFYGGTSYGFPNDHIIVPQKLNGEVVFGTTDGLLSVEQTDFDGEQFTVFMPTTLGDSTLSDAIFYVTEDEKHIWYCIDNDVVLYNKKERSYIKRPFWGIKKGRVNTLYRPEHKDYLWIGATEGLIRYNIKGDIPFKKDFNTLIRSVFTKDKQQVFGGHHSKKNRAIELEYENNYILFKFSAPYFEDHQPIEYSYKLKGSSDEWSEWSEKTEREFPNLKEGTYTFMVKARNVYHQEAKPAKIEFTILTPWYRSASAYTAYILIFLVIIYLAIVISSYRLKQQNRRLESAVKERTKEIEEKNHRLEDQKTEILHQKTEIEDSINYAQRIQQAILPLKEEMEKHLTDSFITFWPKDVVSGDFYWFYQRGEESIIVCADCTGHGVPGAFMSMIGVDKLNVCVGEKGITSPDKILSFLNEGIKTSLRQDDSKKATRDGMDAAIITINQKEKTVKYAGAHRPLWFIQEGELHEIRATKMAVGGFTPINQEYKLHEFTIDKTTSFYMTSDGYADQFGGPRNKKFKVKAMKTLLIENYEKPMKEQQEVLEQEMKAWSEGYEQVDDICVIGVVVEIGD